MRVLKIAAVVTVIAGAVALGVVLAPEAFGQTRVRTPRARAVQLLTGGAHIGVTVRDMDSGDAKEKVSSGVVIDEVYSESPASRAGLKAGDVVIEFDGERVRSARQFSRLVAETPEGRGVKLGLMRDGQRLTVDITPETRSGIRGGEWAIGETFDRLEDLQIDVPPVPKVAMPGFEFKVMTRTSRLGVQIDTLSPQLATYFGVKRGALITNVDEGSPAQKAGMKAGDVIVAIDGRTIEDTADIHRALRGVESGAEVAIDIVRDRKPQTLKATPESMSGPRKARRRVTDI